MYEIVTYRKLFVESSRVKIREKIENFESAKYLQNLRNIQNEDVTQIIRLVIERLVMCIINIVPSLNCFEYFWKYGRPEFLFYKSLLILNIKVLHTNDGNKYRNTQTFLVLFLRICVLREN